jgi:hypothetical protein
VRYALIVRRRERLPQIPVNCGVCGSQLDFALLGAVFQL